MTSDFRRELGQQLRVDSVRASAAAGSGHPTSSMSAADLMAVLLDGHLRIDSSPDDPRNDHLILLQGPRLAAVLLAAQGGRRDRRRRAADVPQARQPARGPPHSDPPLDRRGDRLARQGLPISVGVALAGKRLDRLPYRVWCLCGDSEMAEGSMWEAFEHASTTSSTTSWRSSMSTGLGRRARRCSAGTSSGYVRRLEAFGWHAIAIDGHDVDAIESAYADGRVRPPAAHGDRRPHEEGQGRQGRSRTSPGKHGKPLDDPTRRSPSSGGERELSVDVAKPAGRRARTRF
jgi:transketolase